MGIIKSFVFGIILFLSAANTPLLAQNSGIGGVLSTTTNELLPYANVIILGKSVGTSTNFDGEYTLPLSAGSHRISFQFVGYKSQIISVELKAGEYKKLDVTLAEEKLLLDMVVVRPNAENPAYSIIRGAQENKKKYLNENKDISYKAYTKLFGRCAENRSSSIRFLGTLLEPMEGIFYLSESVTEIFQYTYENKTEVLKASLVLNDNSGYSKNTSNFIEFYQDYPMTISNGAVSNRVISPIAKEAFTFYDYELKGSIKENGLLIHKIEVIPRTKNGITFEGVMYIIDDSWRLYEAQLSLNNPLLGSFQINSAFIENASQNTWLPFSCSISLEEDDDQLAVFYHSIFFDFNFEKAPPAYQKQANYIVTDSLLLKDSTWWANTRPIELTADEQAAYQKGKALNKDLSKDSTNLADTLLLNTEQQPKSINNKIFESLRTNLVALNENLVIKTDIFTFNTIEGGVFKPGVIVKAMPNQKELIADVSLRYGFASNTFFGKGSLSYELSPKHLTKIQVEAGSYVEEISGNESISDFWNMAYSLFEQNFIKLYQKNFSNIVLQTELANGLDASISTAYAVRYPLQNNSSYNWAKEANYNYTPNQALVNGEYLNFQKSDLWESSILLSYKHKRRFNLIKGRKIPLTSKFPLLNFKFDVGRLDVDYARYVVNVVDSWSLGRFGSSTLSASFGEYLEGSNLTPIDLFHFTGNQTSIFQTQQQYGLSYQLLDYYSHSTSDSFVGANFKHDFNSLVFAKIPFLKKIGLKSYLMANILQVKDLATYSELGFGLSSSYLPIKLNYHFGFQGNQQLSNGFTLLIKP